MIDVSIAFESFSVLNTSREINKKVISVVQSSFRNTNNKFENKGRKIQLVSFSAAVLNSQAIFKRSKEK